jgi:hypothetical protein
MATDSTTPLTEEEELFALSVIECSGNIVAAFQSVWGEGVRNPAAHARMLLNQPNVLARITALQAVQTDTALLSMSSHLIELARIRDLSKLLQNPKVALDAERSRGEVMGFYNKTVSGDDPTESRIEAVRATIRAALAVAQQ